MGDAVAAGVVVAGVDGAIDAAVAADVKDRVRVDRQAGGGIDVGDDVPPIGGENVCLQSQGP